MMAKAATDVKDQCVIQSINAVAARTLPEGAVATASRDFIGESNKIHEASLQQHLGVPRALGILSLRAALSHPVREQRHSPCQSAVTKK